MDNTTIKALRIVIDWLDEQMEESPSRELADVTNWLENEYQKASVDAK